MREKDDNLRIVLALGRELENRGIPVYYTRTEDVFQTPFEKARIANETGADYFLSIHRNSGVNPGEYSGVESLVYEKSGPALELAENIDGAMGEIGFRDIGVFAEPEIVVLRRTEMPAVLAEIGFINSGEDNRILEENFDEVIQSLADAVEGTLAEERVQAQAVRTYRVQVGLFREKNRASGLMEQIKAEGFPVILDADQGIYRIQVGNYQELENAVTMERLLRKSGFSTVITN